MSKPPNESAVHTSRSLADEPIVDIGFLSDGAQIKVMLLFVLFAPLLLMEGLRLLFRR
jgi:hypothetical protein